MSSGHPNNDDLLVDWLYGELEADAAERFEKSLDAETRAEARALERTRAALQSLPEEEPPASVSAILLHEAAVVAKSHEKASSGFFARVASWLQPIVLHPAAMAMATVLLVGGVAGALYLHKGDRIIETPAVQSRAPEPSVDDYRAPLATAPSVDLPKAETMPAEAPALAESAGAAAPGYAAANQSDGEGWSREARMLGQEQQNQLSSKLDQDRDAKQKTIALRPEQDRSELKSRDKNTSKPLPQRSRAQAANVITGADALVEELADEDGAETAVLGGVTAQSQPGDAARGPANTVATKTPTFAAPPPDPRGEGKYADESWVKKRETELTAAVRKKRCQDAARIANDIFERAPAYYRERLQGSEAVKSCQWYVSDERKRRDASRAKGKMSKKRAVDSTGDSELEAPASAK